MLKSTFCLAMALTLAPTIGSAQDFSAGFAAYDVGDFATALREWMPLAHQGDVYAQYNLGLMYSRGEGVPQDYAEAVNWFRKAAKQGDAGAQDNLGVAYAEGEGVPQDYAEAVNWFRKAAEQGRAGAQANLGVAYAKGYGVPQDYVSAHKWFNLASGNGDADGASWRDAVAAKMTPADISEAQRLARVCLSSAYQDCD